MDGAPRLFEAQNPAGHHRPGAHHRRPRSVQSQPGQRAKRQYPKSEREKDKGGQLVKRIDTASIPRFRAILELEWIPPGNLSRPARRPAPSLDRRRCAA
jgi:hypothetical protein